MDRRHLEYFLAVADSGSFTRAAAALNIAQPSLSHTVLMLERELGAQLFERLGRGVKLTPAGQALLDPARRALGAFERARAAVRGVTDIGFGQLSVITNTLWAIEPLGRIIGEFRQRHPAVQFTVADPLRRSDVLEQVRSGQADFGLLDGIPPGGALESQWLIDHRLVAVLPPLVLGNLSARAEPLFHPERPERSGGPVTPDHPQPLDRPGAGRPGAGRPGAGRPTRPTVSLAELVPFGLVCTPRGTALRELLEAELQAAGESCEIAVETAHLASVVPLVLAGAGAALLPEGLAAAAAAEGARVLDTVEPRVAAVHLIWRAGGLTGAAEEFRSMAGSGRELSDPRNRRRLSEP